MAPNPTSTPTGVLFEDDPVEELQVSLNNDHEQIEPPKPVKEYKLEIVWRNVILYTALVIASMYGGYLMITNAKWLTCFWTFLLYLFPEMGVTAGAHRLWTHKSYKAKWPLKLILIILDTIAFQNSAYEWARDHRVHHKYSETNADPHNAKRGFFFSHVGWLLCRKHPDVIEKGRGIDMSDLLQDPFIVYQKKYYLIIMPFFCFILPTIVPVYGWGETWHNAFFVAALFRYFFTLNITWLVNSAAHMWGNRPYDQYIYPAENRTVAILTFGEGWHNYHHAFPWDYKTSELKIYEFNFTTAFIDFFAKIGWAYDLKTVSPEMIRKRVKRTGDGSHAVWGWGDKDIPKEDIQEATIINPEKVKESANNKKDA